MSKTVFLTSEVFYSDFKWSLLPHDPSNDFKSGGRNALRVQKQRFDRVNQGKLSLEDFLKLVLHDIKTIGKSREEAVKGYSLCPKVLTNYIETTPQLITLVFDDCDRPSPTKHLLQFERKVNFQSIHSETKEVSVEALFQHILPQVVILLVVPQTILDEEKTYLTIVTIDKEGYEDLLMGKLGDTIVFQGLIVDGQAPQRGELNTFQYFSSGLSDYIAQMALEDYEIVEVKAVSDKIRYYQQQF